MFEHPLREIPRYTLFCKTVNSWLPTVNADIHTPYLPVNITRFTKNYGILLMGISYTSVYVRKYARQRLL